MQTCHLIYFSPTGTTRKVALAVARGLGAPQVAHYDLTKPGSVCHKSLKDGVAVIGCPVYAGRVPELYLQRLQGLTAQGVPALLVALYGNREFEDALVELRDVAVNKGFRVIAAGAFIGEHSYSTLDRPIAAGRPDAGDLASAVLLGMQSARKLARHALDTPQIDGHVPYRERVPIGGIAPETDVQACVLCGKCAEVCPTGVITLAGSVVTKADGCIMCCACVKGCVPRARLFNHPRIEERRALLEKNCREPKVPVLFL
jgi:ferredoxin